MATTQSELVFACHSKACAPPPAGSGGSMPSGGGGGGGGGGTGGGAARVAAVRTEKISQLKSGTSRSVQFGANGNHYDATVTPVDGGFRAKLSSRGKGMPGEGPLGRSKASKVELDFVSKTREGAAAGIQLATDGRASMKRPGGGVGNAQITPQQGVSKGYNFSITVSSHTGRGSTIRSGTGGASTKSAAIEKAIGGLDGSGSVSLRITSKPRPRRRNR